MFEGDEEKSLRNLAERGFDFEFACRIFAGDIIEQDDARLVLGLNPRMASVAPSPSARSKGTCSRSSIPGAKDDDASYRHA